MSLWLVINGVRSVPGSVETIALASLLLDVVGDVGAACPEDGRDEVMRRRVSPVLSNVFLCFIFEICCVRVSALMVE